MRILKSIPIVVINDVVNESSLNRRSRQLFPTPGGVRIEGGRIDGRREERRRERTRTRRRDATSDAGWAKRRRTTTDARRDGRGRLGPDDATDLTATARRRGRPAVFSLARDRSALAGAGTDAAAASARPRARSRATGRTAVSDEEQLDDGRLSRWRLRGRGEGRHVTNRATNHSLVGSARTICADWLGPPRSGLRSNRNCLRTCLRSVAQGNKSADQRPDPIPKRCRWTLSPARATPWGNRARDRGGSRGCVSCARCRL